MKGTYRCEDEWTPPNVTASVVLLHKGTRDRGSRKKCAADHKGGDAYPSSVHNQVVSWSALLTALHVIDLPNLIEVPRVRGYRGRDNCKD